MGELFLGVLRWVVDGEVRVGGVCVCVLERGRGVG